MKWEWFCGTVQVKEYGIGSLQAGKKDGNSPLVYVSYSSSFRIFHYTREGQNISQYCCLPGKRQRLLFAGVSGPCSLPGPLVARLYLICGVCGPKNWTIKSDFLQAGTTQQVLNEDLPLQSEEKVRDLSVGVPKDVRQPKKKKRNGKRTQVVASVERPQYNIKHSPSFVAINTVEVQSSTGKKVILDQLERVS